MQVVADQVATALVGVRMRERSRRLQDESQRRAQRLELASDLSREIAATGTVDELLRTVTVTLHRHTDYTAVWTAVADHRHGTQRMWTITRGPRHGDRVGAPARLGHHRPGRPHRASRRCSAAPTSPTPAARGRRPGTSRCSRRRWWSNRRCEAVIGLSDLRADQFDNSDALLMRTLAEQVAAALQRRGAAGGVRPPRHPPERHRRGRPRPALARDGRAGAARRRPGDQPLHRLLRPDRVARGAATGDRRAVFARDRGTDVYTGLRVPAGAGIPGAAITSGKVLRLGPRRRPPRVLVAGPRPEQLGADRPGDGGGRLRRGARDLGRASQLVRQRRRGAGQGDRRPHRRRHPGGAAARGVGAAGPAAVARGRDRRSCSPPSRRPESALRVAVRGRARARPLRRGHGHHGARGVRRAAGGGRRRRRPRRLRRAAAADRHRDHRPHGRLGPQTLINRHEDDPAYAPWGDGGVVRLAALDAGHARRPLRRRARGREPADEPVRRLRPGADDRRRRAARRRAARRAAAQRVRAAGAAARPDRLRRERRRRGRQPPRRCCGRPSMRSSSRPTTAP